MSKNLSRRSFLKGTAALASALTLHPDLKERLFTLPQRQDIPSAAPITILINDSPWFDGFEALVNLYRETTGNEVNLDLTPFGEMLPKTQDATAAAEGPYDIINLNEQWYSQFYGSGSIAPIRSIKPDYEFDRNIIEYEYATRWNTSLGISTRSGELYGLPINGNIQLYFARRDMLENAGMDTPRTWDEVEAFAAAVHRPPAMHGFAVRASPINWELQAYFKSLGTDYVVFNVDRREWTIGTETAAARQAVETWLRLGQTYAPVNYLEIDQPALIKLVADGLLAQAHMVGAAAPNFQNPDISVVADIMEAAPVPGFTPDSQVTVSGIWVMGIPVNVPLERQQAALTFLEWVLTEEAQTAYTRAGAIPVRQDVYEGLSDDPSIGWWARAFAASTPLIRAQVRIPEVSQIYGLVDTHMKSLLADDIGIDEALETLSSDIRAVMVDAGYSLAT